MSNSSSRPTPDQWRQIVLLYLSDHPTRSLKTRGLARALDVHDEDYKAFRELCHDMLASGQLILGPKRSLKLPDQSQEMVGTFRANARGFGFVEIPARPDIYIPPVHVHDALDGDKVAIQLIKPNRQTGQARAEILRIVERASLAWPGVLQFISGEWIVRPQGKHAAPALRIDDPSAKDAEEGDLVIVEPLLHTLRHRQPRGVIIERIGDVSSSRNIVLAAIRRYDLPHEFPEEVRIEAQEVAVDFEATLTDDREDLRELLTITIDPESARDFDDAISIEPMDNDMVRLGVHIADVAHFVKTGSHLDREAYERGNSVYFPGYVVPMLPELLSNGVCSLQPDVPRYAKSAFITYDAKGRVKKTEFCNSVIQSNARLTYEQVTAALADESDGISAEVLSLIKMADTLAKRIHKRRMAQGMIVLTLPELEIRLDEHGEAVDAGPADTSFSHTIIEMFMVEANEAVCRMLVGENVPHLRRIHPEPAIEAAKSLQYLRPLLGRELPNELTRETIRSLLTVVHGKPEEQAVNFVLLRAMAPAIYSPTIAGHFALASEHYCHFTSPIRRYPDLTIHRLFDEYVRGELKEMHAKREIADEDEWALASVGRQTSATERRAQQAEREAKTDMLLSVMQTKLGEVVDGIITGVMSFGAFVQIHPMMAEGLVRVDDFGGDVWEFDDRRALFTGIHTRRQIFIGQRVRVTVASVDQIRKELLLVPEDTQQFGVVRKSESNGGDRSERRRHAHRAKRRRH